MEGTITAMSIVVPDWIIRTCAAIGALTITVVVVTAALYWISVLGQGVETERKP